MNDDSKKLDESDVCSKNRQHLTTSTLSEKLSKKELWQMTRAEYEAAHGQLRGNTTVTGKFSPHKNAVEVAINRGLPVPKEVLADYPSLASE
ncbi:MAG: hypothetical protein AB7T49_00280 [Oligoflexales bacterium]